MSSTPDAMAQQKLYRRFRGGDAGALSDLLEAERPVLFDYLLRMTGQVSRSAETVDEVFLSLSEEVFADLEDYRGLRVCLLMTARKFNADIWDADTAKLVNARLEAPTPEGVKDDEARLDPGELQSFLQLDRGLRVLPGQERECVYLRGRLGLTAAEVAEIMNLHVDQVEKSYEDGLRQLSSLPGGTDALPKFLGRLLLHPVPHRSSHATVNLSMVMQGIKTRPVGIWSPVRLTIVALLVAAGLVAFFMPEVGTRLWEALHGRSTTSGRSGGGAGGSSHSMPPSPKGLTPEE